MLPGDVPPVTTVQRYVYARRYSGLWVSINHPLLMDYREAEGREALPSAGVIDSQSVKAAESGGYAGDKLRHAPAGRGDWVIEIIKRSDTAKKSSGVSRADGSRNAPSSGSAETDVWPRALRRPSSVRPHGSSWPRSSS
jgi:transposase